MTVSSQSLYNNSTILWDVGGDTNENQGNAALAKVRLVSMLAGIIVIGLFFLIYACTTLYTDKKNAELYWNMAFDPPAGDISEDLKEYEGIATPVTVGIYVETLKEINIKSNYLRIVFQVWFSWQGNNDIDMKDNFMIYKGTMNNQTVLRDDYYEDIDTHYQLIQCDVTVAKTYWTQRFPLENHQLTMYLESEYPAGKVLFQGDIQQSGVNPALSVSGYMLGRSGFATTAYKYENSHGDPRMSGSAIIPEYFTVLEINRSGFGVYIKCVIALFGTSAWVLLVLYLNIYHRIDPLSMIPAALFGTVSNIMVGANLLPDALELGLIEYVNIWGILTIFGAAISIVNVNRIRAKYEDKEFARFFGKICLFSILFLVIAGHILLPACSYIF